MAVTPGHPKRTLERAVIVAAPVALIDPVGERERRPVISDPQEEILVVVDLSGQPPGREEPCRHHLRLGPAATEPGRPQSISAGVVEMGMES